MAGRDGEVAESGAGKPGVSTQSSAEGTALLASDELNGPRGNLIIGIGASAGGIEAFKRFFASLPSDTDMAFVLVQHLAPDHESILPTIIADVTDMTVRVAEHGHKVGPNEVYVIPPNAILTIHDGVLSLAAPETTAARRTAIDTFFTSLAEDQRENAVGIVLSGFGSDGAHGIAAIKERGGLTLTQADFGHHAMTGMPQNAAQAGFVDHVLTIEEMPSALLNYRQHRTIVDAPHTRDSGHQDIERGLPEICAELHARLGRDFSRYKTGTLLRRIERRMYLLQITDVPEYIERLKSSDDEAGLLFQELLISVTRFFRDGAAFVALEAKVLASVLAEGASTQPIRVWVAGCATGEEAYSIAILLKEGLARAGSRRSAQVFATDLDDRAIAVARSGLYPETIAADLSIERLEGNFIKEAGGYRVTKDIREMCLFSTHDLVRDPPFSKLDLITCRNLLIYFEPDLQQQVFTTFHYALHPGGHLFLGPSESIAAQTRLFEPIDKRHRLYLRRSAAVSFPAFSLSRSPQPVISVKRPGLVPSDEIDKRANRALLRYTPSYIVVDAQHEILRFSGQTARYIEPMSGAASLNLFNLLHAGLRGSAQAALKHAAATGERVVCNPILMDADSDGGAVKMVVEPLGDTGSSNLLMLGFIEVEASIRRDDAATSGGVEEGNTASTIRALDSELHATKERLRLVTDELLSGNQELQASHEEYLSMNEEFQSANEELETSKEELQSLNEELQTINTELNHRNDSLARSNSDLSNLFDSTSIATLFLDNDLRIRRFTPRVLELFKLRDGDEGRPITDIVSRLSRDGLKEDVQQVLHSLVPLEREMMVIEGDSYLMQIRPYRDRNNAVDGVVVTFVDISERKRHEQARSRLAAIVESSQDAIISHGLGGIVTSWNAGAERLFGYPAADAIGQPMTMLLTGALPDDWPNIRTKLEQGEEISRFDAVRIGNNRSMIDVSVTISPVTEGDGRIVGASVVARDISRRKAAEQKAALLLGELDHRVKNILAIVSAVVSQTLKSSGSPEAFATELEGRIKAIAVAHSLLTKAGHGEVSLQDIVETELAPFNDRSGRITVAGDPIDLTPRAGMALAMAIHELASNAAKYGALSVPNGKLTVEWQGLPGPDGGLLELAWRESDGPAVEPPTRRGFGTTLIERSLGHELDAAVVQEFLASGLRCSISIPLTEEVTLKPTAA